MVPWHREYLGGPMVPSIPRDGPVCFHKESLVWMKQKNDINDMMNLWCDFGLRFFFIKDVFVVWAQFLKVESWKVSRFLLGKVWDECVSLKRSI